MAKMQGEVWSNPIAQGQGTYLNCNASKCLYLWCALGKVYATNMHVQKGLRFIAAYMTLGELVIKPSFARYSRCLGRGQRPSVQNLEEQGWPAFTVCPRQPSA